MAGNAIPPPYFGVDVTDREKLSFATDAYQKFLAGGKAADLPDIRRIFKDEAPATARLAEPQMPVALNMPSLTPPAIQEKVREAKAALNQPMPYRPPVEDDAAAETVVTGAIPLPTPKPAI